MSNTKSSSISSWGLGSPIWDDVTRAPQQAMSQSQLAANQHAQAQGYQSYDALYGYPGPHQAQMQGLPTAFERQTQELKAKVAYLEIELKKAQELIEELGYKPEYF